MPKKPLRMAPIRASESLCRRAGVLRAGINLSNASLVSNKEDPTNPEGIAPGLAAELARQLQLQPASRKREIEALSNEDVSCFVTNMRVLAAALAPALTSTDTPLELRALELDELLAETYAAEPLTWLEAAIFFLFACAEYPAEAERWAPLAEQRWQRYLVSAHLVDDDGEATLALARARAAHRVPQVPHAEGARA